MPERYQQTFITFVPMTGMRTIIRIMMAVLLPAAVCASCGRKGKAEICDVRQMQTECIIKTTPVKDQGRSSLCWAYAMLATIESEHLMAGDSVNLSPAYVARVMLEEQTDRFYLSGGTTRITTRGIAPKLLRLIMQYGLTHYDAFHTEANINVICRKLRNMAQNAITYKTGLEHLRNNAARLLDDEIHTVPQRVYMLGAEYTTAEFARSVCRQGEYTPLTSYSHHPFNECFALEIPDNDDNNMFLNVPIDTMTAIIERSLRTGHPVCWEGDISEPGFSFGDGIAVLSNYDRRTTQEARQKSFETFETTDDHCMELIGIAHDRTGHKYFICKNSWGRNNPFGGLIYMDEEYLRLKTVAVVVKTECLFCKEKEVESDKG